MSSHEADEQRALRVVALEEHVSFRRFRETVDPELARLRGFPPGGMGDVGDALDDVDGLRLQLMDEAGITMQVLSVVGPGSDLLPPGAGAAFARRYNDDLAAVVREHPERFSAFAHLPLSGALINGTTDGRFLDDARFEPVLACAEALDVPLYLHPAIPPEPVRRAFFSEPPFLAALLTFGPDRILFSVDYPYSDNRAGRAFLDRLPVDANDRTKIAHANADRVLKLVVPSESLVHRAEYSEQRRRSTL